jgi:hypothetical protein
MAISNTVLTDTFNAWRGNTNQTSSLLNRITEGGHGGVVSAGSITGNNFVSKANAEFTGGVNFSNATNVVYKTAEQIKIMSSAGAGYSANMVLKLHDTTSGNVFLGNVKFSELEGTLSAGQLGNTAINANTIFSTSVVTSHALAPGSVDAVHLATDSVTAAKIAADAVGNTEIATSAVGTAELKTNAVVTAKVTDAAITAPKIGPGAVTAPKLGPASVTSGKIGPGAVSANTMFGAGAITSHAIGSASIDAVHLATNIIANTNLIDGSVGSAEIGPAAVIAAKIGTDAVTNTHIATSAVGTAELAPGSVTSDKLGSSLSSAEISNVQVFWASGPATWTKPADVTAVQVICVGGGSGGGGAGPGAGAGEAGNIGGLGYAWVSSLAGPVSVTVGAGGNPGPAPGGAGGAGGSSTFGTHITSTGGPISGPGPAPGTSSGPGAIAFDLPGNGSTFASVYNFPATPNAHGNRSDGGTPDHSIPFLGSRLKSGGGGSGGPYNGPYNPGGWEGPNPASFSAGGSGSNGAVIVIGYKDFG